MDQLLTEERIADVKRTEASAGTWSRVVRLIEAHPDVKQVRLNINEHSVSVGFYETPSQETLNRIKTDVRAAALRTNGMYRSRLMINRRRSICTSSTITRPNFIALIPADEPPVIWKSIPLPAWRNRPFPRPVAA